MFLNVVVGILVLSGSFFTLPFRYIKETGLRLAEIGEQRTVVVEQTEDVPLLSWLLVCGRVLITVSAILLYLVIIWVGIATNEPAPIVLSILLGWVPSVFLVWFLGIWLEHVALSILMVQLPNFSPNIPGLYLDRRGPAAEHLTPVAPGVPKGESGPT